MWIEREKEAAGSGTLGVGEEAGGGAWLLCVLYVMVGERLEEDWHDAQMQTQQKSAGATGQGRQTGGRTGRQAGRPCASGTGSKVRARLGGLARQARGC